VKAGKGNNIYVFFFFANETRTMSIAMLC